MWSRFRPLVFWVHLVLGLILALPIGVMCITGAALAYKIQIETWVDLRGAHSNPPFPGARPLNVETLIGAIRKNRAMEPEAITIFRNRTRPAEVDLKDEGPVYLDVYSGTVIGGHSRTIHQFFERVTAWHLSLGVSGPHSFLFRALEGAANGMALLLAILGVFLWLPRRWRWSNLRPVIFFRWGATGRAKDFNRHNVVGIWIALPLLVIVWTGVDLSYNWAGRLANRNAPRSKISLPASAALRDVKSSRADISGLNRLLSRAEEQCAGWNFVTLYLPRQRSEPVHFAIGMKEYPGFGTIAGLALDRTGAAVYFTPAGAAELSRSTFIHYGHTGEAWGIPGQTVAGVTCVGGVIMMWTGIALSFRRWRSHLRLKRLPFEKSGLKKQARTSPQIRP